MEKIRHYRELKKWTQEQLALESGVSQAMISAAESGKRIPRLPLLRKIANALGVGVHELISREEGGKVEPEELIEILEESLSKNPETDTESVKIILQLLRKEIDKSQKNDAEE